MQKLTLLLTLFCLITFSIQPVFASDRYSVTEMAACTPVGDIAMKMMRLQKQGYKWKRIQFSVKKNIPYHLALWVTPIANLVISNPNSSSEEIVKQTIRYCLRTNKKHRKPKRENSI